MEDVMNDKRFKHIARDPRFRRLQRKDRKVQIDKRFQGMFKEKRFKLKYSVDKRGRPVHSTTNENLERFYDLQSSSDEDDDEDAKAKKSEQKKNKKEDSSSSDEEHNSQDEGLKSIEKRTLENNAAVDQKAENDESESEGGEDDEESEDSGPDWARGQGNVETSSSEDEDDAADEDNHDVDHHWGELDQGAMEATEVTRRLALCNMDWDRIKASDIMVLVNSFKSSRGTIESVQIYPSEYGLQRMKEEDERGPAEIVNAKEEDDVSNRERLRQYQLNRLRYYYAVITCDSVETANQIYDECDGMEYESSSNKIDLRYIPDDMTFEHPAKSEATQMPDSTSYKPTLFTNAALNQSKVELTWDETDKDRIALTMRKFNQDELEEMDVKQYLASSSDEGGDDPYAGFEDPDFGTTEPAASNTVSQLKEVVTMSREKEKKEGERDLEIQWDSDLQTSAALRKNKDLTPWEGYLQKKKEKRKKKKEEKASGNKETVEEADNEEAFSDDDLPTGVDLNDPYFAEELKGSEQGKLEKKKKKKKGGKGRNAQKETDPEEEAKLRMLMMDDEDGRQHFSLEAIQQAESDQKKKRRKKKKKAEEEASMAQDDFQLNLGDTRFKEIYENPLYNIDPSAPEYKKTKAMDALVTEKFKLREKGGKKKKSSSESAVPAKKAKTDTGNDSVEGLEDSSLASLVKSVKTKTKMMQERKKKKHKL